MATANQIWCLSAQVKNGTLRLLHNIGDGKFADKTSGSGLTLSGSGLGCAAGDFDNDGKTDLAVCMGDGVHLFSQRWRRKIFGRNESG